jgi:hypothetical protein
MYPKTRLIKNTKTPTAMLAMVALPKEALLTVADVFGDEVGEENGVMRDF